MKTLYEFSFLFLSISTMVSDHISAVDSWKFLVVSFCGYGIEKKKNISHVNHHPLKFTYDSGLIHLSFPPSTQIVGKIYEYIKVLIKISMRR